MRYIVLQRHFGHDIGILGIDHRGKRQYVGIDMFTVSLVVRCFDCRMDLVSRDYDHYRKHLIRLGEKNGWEVPSDLHEQWCQQMYIQLMTNQGFDEDALDMGVDELAEAEGWVRRERSDAGCAQGDGSLDTAERGGDV